jgi:methylmalonyl-CoA mutase N-terminal domain/subunit
MIGDSARAWQERLEQGEEKQVGVNAYRLADDPSQRPPPLPRPDPARIDAYLERLAAYKKRRDGAAVGRALDALARAADRPEENTFARTVEAAETGATHGEICARVRDVMGFGEPLVVA